jgi:hypothetical protein
MLDENEVQRRLEYRPPTDATRPAYEMSRALVRLLFEVWNRTLPPGREAALALTALEEAHSWSNAAVARNAGDDWQLEPIDVSGLLDALHPGAAVRGGRARRDRGRNGRDRAR